MQGSIQAAPANPSPKPPVGQYPKLSTFFSGTATQARPAAPGIVDLVSDEECDVVDEDEEEDMDELEGVDEGAEEDEDEEDEEW